MTKDELDMVEFEKTQLRRIYESKISGLHKRYRETVEFEIEGIEDILEWLPVEVRASVQERCDRIRRAMQEIQ